MDYKERNRRALRALTGLILVFTTGMIYLFGVLEDKLSAKFTGYILPKDMSSEENLDAIIEKRADR